MNADKTNTQDGMKQLTELVIGCAYEVSNVLGSGFLEKVYENALAYELKTKGLDCRKQVKLPVKYKSVVVGDYLADLVVEDKLLIELKCVDTFAPEHTAQCLNYLKATGLHLCLLMNFQRPKVEIKRIVHEL
ncbi:MAG: GxxExxY protein [Phycisphaeraceae bacterium]|nr:GxxExxY protein [Phycisphaeraceae bacterium]